MVLRRELHGPLEHRYGFVVATVEVVHGRQVRVALSSGRDLDRPADRRGGIAEVTEQEVCRAKVAENGRIVWRELRRSPILADRICGAPFGRKIRSVGVVAGPVTRSCLDGLSIGLLSGL